MPLPAISYDHRLFLIPIASDPFSPPMNQSCPFRGVEKMFPACMAGGRLVAAGTPGVP